MGLILDSSVLVAAERKGLTARQVLAEVGTRLGDEDVAISVVTLIELAHGVTRADTPQRKATRRQFLDELMMGLPVHPVSIPGRCGRDASTGRTSRAVSTLRSPIC